MNRQEALDNAALCAARASTLSADSAASAAASRAWAHIAALYPPEDEPKVKAGRVTSVLPRWQPVELYERFNAAAGFFNNPEWARLPDNARTGWTAIAALVNNDPASTPIPASPLPGRAQ